MTTASEEQQRRLQAKREFVRLALCHQGGKEFLKSIFRFGGYPFYAIGVPQDMATAGYSEGARAVAMLIYKIAFNVDAQRLTQLIQEMDGEDNGRHTGTANIDGDDD